MPRNQLENSCCRFLLFLLFFSIIGGVLEAWHKASVTRYYDFKVQTASITKLCKTSTILTVNGMYPGPTIYAWEDDTVVVKVSNLTPYNISIHLHGVRRRLTCWFDGPAYITQCPIQAGQNFKYRFTLLNQRGTLFWHAYISWLRATVHGPLIIYPKQGVGYPFQPPVEEHVIILGEYWLRDVQGLERHVKESGGGPPGSDAYTLNGLPGPLHNCSRDDVYTINVSKGKNYLLRIINAALNMEHFFMVANHTMTVVETDGEYTKPFKTTFLMLTPGQTYNVLLKADLSIGKYMAMAPYMPAKNVPFLMKTSCGILRYASPTVKVDKLAQNCDAPDSDRCQGPDGGIFAASVNNVTFRRPMVSLLNAYYNNLQGYYSTDFPDKPEKMYDFVNGAPNNISVDTQSAIGTQVSILEHGWAVQVIFQDTGTVGTEKHPIHLHGFSFYLLGTGLGNYNSTTALLNLNEVHALPSGSAHNMGTVNGFSSEEWERQNAEFATSTS
ncbi:hypothetical protein PVK06_039271 [Gossypium arboreum]|uniref:laccase n=1 Tax=Gossypium arboreum TaxID=29729 RepID=A0ABR0N2G0_GOSAR|nr:hypothetical protein PVK06_039271 [Gossypium arboreum]